MAPATVVRKSDAQTVTTDDTAAAVESDGAAEPVQDTLLRQKRMPQRRRLPATPAEDNTADNAATQEPSQDQTDTPAADQSTDSSLAEGWIRKRRCRDSGSRRSWHCRTGREENSDASEETSTGRFTSRMQRAIQTECKTLADAILIWHRPAQIECGSFPDSCDSTIEISDTIVISDSRNVSIAAAEDGTVIKRADGFLDDMFMVQGENTAFQFGTGKNGDTVLSLTVDASSADDATGSIASSGEGYLECPTVLP